MKIWKVIEDFPDYSVSSDGEIKNNKTNRIKKPIVNKRLGYCHTVLSYGEVGKRKKKTVRYHKYVAKYFCENPNNLKEANHINGLKTDNHPSNLEYVTSSYNKKHAYAKGLRGLEGQVAMVRANKKKCVVIDKKTGVEYSFDSYVEAAKHFKKNPRWISDIIHKANGETKNFIVKSEDL